MSIEAMKQALEALEEPREHIYKHRRLEAITSLRQAIAMAQTQEQMFDLMTFGVSWSKDGKRIDPSEVCSEAETSVATNDTSQDCVDETAKQRHEAAKQKPVAHWSDCAVHNEPAYPAGECDCGGYTVEAAHGIKGEA